MEHVRVPIYVVSGKPRQVPHVLRDRAGQYLASMPYDRGKEAREIVASVNQRDALLAQRDALAGACEGAQDSLVLVLELLKGTMAHDVVRGGFVGVSKQIADALALVRE